MADAAWDLFAHHRARLTDAIRACTANPTARLCVLGAGPCNDIDLEALADAFAEIHLVDIDAFALSRAVAREAPPVRARLRAHASVDLSGITSRLKKWRRKPPTQMQLDALSQSTRQALLAELPGPFDVVVSACVLTQMGFAVRSELGDAHPMLEAIRASVVATHMRTLVALTAVGGTALFVTDLASSNHYPLGDAAPGSLLRVMNDIVDAGAYYHAANPSLIGSIITADDLRARVKTPVLLEPWLWTGAMDRTYLVYALRIPRIA